MSAPYHTARCNGQPGCRCIEDHNEWADECDAPPPMDMVRYLIVILVVYALIVYTFWGDSIANFLSN
jgi:hypothetical protein